MAAMVSRESPYSKIGMDPNKVARFTSRCFVSLTIQKVLKKKKKIIKIYI